MPRTISVSKSTSFNDSCVLRRASSSTFKGSTSGSFVGQPGGRRSSTASEPPPIEEQLLDAEDIITTGLDRMAPLQKFGYLCQYFAVGIVYGGLPATTYGFFLGYLSVPSYVYGTCTTLLTLPWSFKFLLGALNDCVPICGYRRKPYMVLGWLACTLFLVALYLWPLPAPYYCLSPSGAYVVDEPPCNPSAATSGGVPTFLMMGACLGYVVADVAADGLTVQLARGEPESKRGYTQSTAYMSRSIGQVVAYALVGFGMNGHEYLGSFDVSLSFSQICLCFGCVSACMVPISIFCIHEERLTERIAFSEYAHATWQLLRSKAFFVVVLWQFLNPAIQYVSSTANANIQRYWAGVQTLQNQAASIVSFVLFSLALLLVRERFLNVSWRKMLAATTIVLYIIDAPFTMLTTFDIYRNQYFFLGETLLTEVPDAAFFVVSCFVIVELASDSNAGLIYGLLSTVSNCGKALPTPISNQIFGAFYPALSNPANYIKDVGGDQPCFRRVVAYSVLTSYGFALASLLTMPLMPDQKAHAHQRMATWPHRTSYAVMTVVIIVLGLGYSLSVSFLALTPLACLRFVGGEGCEAADVLNATAAQAC